MAQSLYLASLDASSGKSAIALGVMEQLTKQTGSVAVFRPIVRDEHPESGDPIITLLRQRYRLGDHYADSVGATYSQVRANGKNAMSRIVERYHALAARHEAILIVGSDYTDVANVVEFGFNTQVAVNLAAPMLMVVTGFNRSLTDIEAACRFGVDEAKAAHATILGTVINRVDPELADQVAAAHPEADVIVERPKLEAPTVADLIEAADGHLLSGDTEVLSRIITDVVVAAMTLPNLLNRLSEGKAVILPGDRSEVLLGLLAAHQAEGVPSLSAVFLTGGMRPPPQVLDIVNGMDSRLPIILVDRDTFEMAVLAGGVHGTLLAGGDSKIATALDAFASGVDSERLLSQMRLTTSEAVTPLMFEHRMLERARKLERHIVLPEGAEPRIIKAADMLLRRNVARLTLLGEESAIRQQASELGADIDQARILNPGDHEIRERFAAEYAKLRSHKGVTVDQAMDVVTDVSYFGTMMVHTGMVDGMVSGAVHTTAHTIRPSFEIIKTKPGTSVVSSVFFMCLEDRVLVYGDCAVNPNPTAEQLADIATSSAHTAGMFDIEPRVAMLSYSTGASGQGAEVDKVREATDLVKATHANLAIEGPIQYDAAADASVAGTKLPDSQVAGRATVFIVPDLNTGNNLYKAVQRSAGAIAVGPLLQGLRKPVNDLSRGATVVDIVNTVALTAIQAGEETS
ncbi:phosphate acetyltransferase [Natronoglycomyces albus]|uniref:Phosphate acetyltransferase n=1 Tax=Natronoglycomyces albus TaxID=2811108 RepID=A0A895XGQ1_9ACTN|nr:phosphate acetyltransferase [Natronoglycomyces albus]QSB04067.1 phosphate acetyltransferase [Natronoglycomyces albus]